MNKETQEMNMLKRTIATRRQRLSVISLDNGEPMVKADTYDPTIVVKSALPDMKPFTQKAANDRLLFNSWLRLPET